MTICNALIKLLKGNLTAESPGPGQGSTFTVTFPTITGAPATIEPDGAQQAGFDSHLMKPVNLQKLEVTIRRLLRM